MDKLPKAKSSVSRRLPFSRWLCLAVACSVQLTTSPRALVCRSSVPPVAASSLPVLRGTHSTGLGRAAATFLRAGRALWWTQALCQFFLILGLHSWPDSVCHFLSYVLWGPGRHGQWRERAGYAGAGPSNLSEEERETNRWNSGGALTLSSPQNHGPSDAWRYRIATWPRACGAQLQPLSATRTSACISEAVFLLGPPSAIGTLLKFQDESSREMQC